MTYTAPDADDESDRERLARAEAAHRRRLADALYEMRTPIRAADRGFIVSLRKSDLAVIEPGDRDRFDRLVWKWRRDLPPGLRPKLPPHDPIVRELESAHG